MADYARIHLHFDTFPVSGTTTTLDSLAMGIPVLDLSNALLRRCHFSRDS